MLIFKRIIRDAMRPLTRLHVYPEAHIQVHPQVHPKRFLARAPKRILNHIMCFVEARFLNRILRMLCADDCEGSSFTQYLL